MTPATLTVAIPTLGRPTLARTLRALAAQAQAGDEVLVLADRAGDVDEAADIFMQAGRGSRARWLFRVLDGGCWGHPQRNWAIENAHGSHVWSLNDDDTPADGALELLRAHARTDRAVIFRARFPEGTRFLGQPAGYSDPLVWNDPQVRLGNVDAACVLAPAQARSRWALRYEGDFDFACALQAELGEPVWRPETIVHKG